MRSGVFALIGWSIGVLLGTFLIKGTLDPFLLANSLGNSGPHVPARDHGRRRRDRGRCVGHRLPARCTSPDAAARLYDAAKRLSPIALVGFLPFLFRWRTWIGRDLTFLYLVALFSLAAHTALKAALSSPPLLHGPRGQAFWRALASRSRPFAMPGHAPLAPAAVGHGDAGAAAYAALFATYTLTFHHNLRTAAYDLGLEDNLVYNVLHGIGFFSSTPFSGPTGSHFGNHATFF